HPARDKPKISALVIRADVPYTEPVLDVVLALVFARPKHAKLALRIISLKDARLRGGVAARFQNDVGAVARAARPNVDALVAILVDEDVSRIGSAAHVPPELELALLLIVLNGVEQMEAVGGPHDGSHALHRAGKQFARFQILDVKRVLAESRVI